MTRTPPHKVYTEVKKARNGQPSEITELSGQDEDPTLALLALENLRAQIKLHSTTGFTAEHAYTSRILRDILMKSTTQLESILRTDQ